MDVIFLMMFIPILMIICGFLLWKVPPKKINYWYGYRTKNSMKNQESWDYAQKNCGKFWIFIGLAMLVVSGVIYFITFNMDNISSIATITCIVEVVMMLLAVPYTEIKLKNNFKEDN